MSPEAVPARGEKAPGSLAEDNPQPGMSLAGMLRRHPLASMESYHRQLSLCCGDMATL